MQDISFRKAVAIGFEEDCSWIEYTSDIYNSYRGIPKDRFLNPTYVNYDILVYLLFGNDVMPRSSRSFFKDRCIANCIGLDKEVVAKAAEDFSQFYKVKMGSILRVKTACYEVGNMKMEEIEGIGSWIKVMSERGVEPFKKAKGMSVREFMSTSLWSKILLTTDALLKLSRDEWPGIYGREILKQYDEIPKIHVLEFNAIFASMYRFSVMIPRVHEAIVEELTKLLKTLFNFDDERVKSVLRCYWRLNDDLSILDSHTDFQE